MAGIDVSSRMLEVARKALPEARFVQAAAEDLPFASASFDTVMCVAALSYLDARVAVSEWARVLRPGGVVLLTAHEREGVTSSRVMRQAGREVGVELSDPNGATGSREALDDLARSAGLVPNEGWHFIDNRPSRLSPDSFDLQIDYFGRNLQISDAVRERWRRRFIELAASIETEEQRILIAQFRA